MSDKKTVHVIVALGNEGEIQTNLQYLPIKAWAIDHYFAPWETQIVAAGITYSQDDFAEHSNFRRVYSSRLESDGPAFIRQFDDGKASVRYLDKEQWVEAILETSDELNTIVLGDFQSVKDFVFAADQITVIPQGSFYPEDNPANIFKLHEGAPFFEYTETNYYGFRQYSVFTRKEETGFFFVDEDEEAEVKDPIYVQRLGDRRFLLVRTSTGETRLAENSVASYTPSRNTPCIQMVLIGAPAFVARFESMAVRDLAMSQLDAIWT